LNSQIFKEDKEHAMQVSISPTFYEQLYCTKVLSVAFLYLEFVFVFFWQKDFSKKVVVKYW